MASSSTKEEFTFFWKSDSPFSQWHLANFVVDGMTFNCMEQYMMYQKAVLFDDKEIAKEIMETISPKTQKRLGREVKNFNEEIWKSNRKNIVKKGNLAKFRQNSKLKKSLMATTGTLLVEASPYDKIWGIGLSEQDHRSHDKNTWKGTNLLGYILTDVRTELSKDLDAQ